MKRGITAASAAGFRAQTGPPGTEFLDAETGPQISPPKWVSAHRDKNPGNEWSEIPAETPYLALCRKRAVCKDWMVVCAVRYEPVSDCNSLIMAVLQGIFREIRAFAQNRS
jgi:hypothetical protein